MRTTDVLFAGAVTAILAGRLAVAQDDDPGTLFYLVAPAALVVGVALLIAATRLAEPSRGVAYPLAAAALGFVLAARPGADDGAIALGFLLGGGCLAVVSLLQARELRRQEPAARATAAAELGVAWLLVLAALVVAAGVVVLLLLLPADR